MGNSVGEEVTADFLYIQNPRQAIRLVGGFTSGCLVHNPFLHPNVLLGLLLE